MTGNDRLISMVTDLIDWLDEQEDKGKHVCLYYTNCSGERRPGNLYHWYLILNKALDAINREMSDLPVQPKIGRPLKYPKEDE